MQGKLVVVEGADCSGKSTFVRYLREKHPEYCYTNEPGGVAYGMEIRRLLLNTPGAEESDNLTKFYLYWASKAENFAKTMHPALMRGEIVVSDRFEGSTFAYQISEDPKLEELFWATRAVCLRNVVPEFIYFDLPVDVAIERGKARSGETNYYDVRGVAYRRKIDAGYRRFFADRRITKHVHRVNANVPMEEMLASAYAIFQEVIHKPRA